MEKNSHRKNKSIILLGASFITLGCVLAVTSLAWFCPPQSNASVTGMSGEATGSYFEGGTGKEGDPYIIATPKQLYYFNWLQDLGYFNKDNDGDGVIDTVYFKITPKDKDNPNELDMSKYTLPPAGTSEYPFVGNFDGNEVVLKDLTISNKYSELTDVPSGANQSSDVLSNAEIVGFFGIIGEYSATASATTTTEVTDETTGVKTTTYVNATDCFKYNVKSVVGEDVTYINAVNDLYFENLTVKSNASNVLAGFIAGYANGQIDNCGVQCGQFSFKDGVSNFSDSVLTESSLSKYALIGDCTSNLHWKGQPGVDDGGTTGNDWGGSINIYELSKRITYIMNDTMDLPSSTSYVPEASPSRFNLNNLSYNKYTSPNYKFYEASGTTAQIYGNSYLPIKVNTSLELTNEITGTKKSTVNSKRSWLTATTGFFNGTTKKEDGSAYTEEEIDKTNPGYITTSQSSDKSNSTWHYIRAMSTVKKSFGGSSYDPDKLVMLTYDGSNFARIVDGSNVTTNTALNEHFPNTVEASSLHKYTDVKNYFSKIYTEGSSSLIYTLGWQNASITSIAGTFKMDTNSGSSQLVEYKSALAPGIDFYVKKAGYIGVVYCSMANGGGGNNLFSLYKVDRSSGTAAKGDRITDGIPSDTGSFFDKDYCILYLEIKVDAGEYFITTDSNWSKSTYADFMYLDIGANSGDEEEETTDPLPTNIDFVYKENGALAKITDEGYTPSGVVFSIGGPSTSAGLIYFKRETKNNKDEGGVVYVGVAYYTAAGCSITPAGNGKSTNKEPDAD